MLQVQILEEFNGQARTWKRGDYALLKIPDSNRKFFGRRLEFKIDEFREYNYQNIVRIPAVIRSKVGHKNWYLSNICKAQNPEIEFNPPVESFYCKRLDKDLGMA